MYINHVSHYVPSDRVPNSYFEKVNGLEDQWIFERTGIRSRSKATKQENTNTMAIEAVKNGFEGSGFKPEEVDLIVGASYSPYDTVYTMGHAVQREFGAVNAKVVYVSSACSSLLNAVEIAEGYIAMGKAKNVIVVAAEHNWEYSNESCAKSGHLWGDGAAAMFISDTPKGNKSAKVAHVYTQGLGHLGKADASVFLRPSEEGLGMPDGRDVFINAVTQMRNAIDKVLDASGKEVSDLSYVVPHQANGRIMSNLQRQMKLDDGMIFSHIEEFGNTGCASTAICFSQNYDKVKQDDLVVFTVFGGGYSVGAMLLQY
ncbi:ketoacyl-ACP synthase III [Halosquirtibacter xylanolyticus]|uniref:3-oxoacyl-ACP synthase III family protein n=1 Tax=Halosquirtibacter xylanolyticus TaxID=3374599 RepID=UPI0037484E44|nr:ketoacyl-ACP synthase III [Prolixibacteraceae bacterium]